MALGEDDFIAVGIHLFRASVMLKLLINSTVKQQNVKTANYKKKLKPDKSDLVCE